MASRCLGSTAIPQRTHALREKFMKRTLTHFLKRCISDECGATAVEYAVLLALILLACIAAVATVGLNTANAWNGNNQSISGSMSHVQ